MLRTTSSNPHTMQRDVGLRCGVLRSKCPRLPIAGGVRCGLGRAAESCGGGSAVNLRGHSIYSLPDVPDAVAFSSSPSQRICVDVLTIRP